MHRILVATVVAFSAVSLAFAGPAGANTDDQTYLDQLGEAGLSCEQGAFDCPDGDNSMVEIAHSICRQMRGGNSELSLAKQIARSRPTVSPMQAAKLVAIAEASYCPRS